MAAQILTNIPSLNAQRNLSQSGTALATSLARLSSGLRINSAKDDAAGLAISERFTAQIRGIDQAARNANDGISLAQTGEGALSSAGSILQRIRELAVQSVNATNSAADRAALNNEVGQLASELDRIAATTAFNGQLLLDGSNSSTYQVGANAGEVITVTTTNFRTDQYGNHRMGAVTATTANAISSDLMAGSTIATLTSSASSANRVVGGTVTINGALGSSSFTVNAGVSAKTVAAQVNSYTSSTGVTSTAKTEVEMTGMAATTTYSFTVLSNNSTAVSINFNTGAITADGLASGVNAINDQSAKTGVTAKANAAGSGIILTNASGENITIVRVSGNSIIGGSAASTGTAIATGQLDLDSDKSFGVVAANATDFFTAAAVSSSLQKTSQVDVGSVDAANRTIALVDGALQAVNGMRAKYGAVQSRFESTVANLKTASENLSASRSRIRDADFALETANLTRNQILQQAGTAMLAQANALPNSVLTLLR